MALPRLTAFTDILDIFVGKSALMGLGFFEDLVPKDLNFGTRYDCKKLAKSRTLSSIKKLILKIAKDDFKFCRVF